MNDVLLSPLRLSELESLIEKSVQRAIANHQAIKVNDQQEDLFTVPQAAKFLTLTVGTVYGLVSSQSIPFMKKGKRVYFLKSELMEYLKSGRGKSLAELSELADKHVQNKKRPR